MYRFHDARGRVLYVGRATELRSRVRSYWGNLRDRRHLVRMIGAVASIAALPCDSVHEAAWLERNLLETALPRWNRTRGGQETPVWLRLDARPGAPGLTVVHDAPAPGPARFFGPYLGGEQARRAVAGLHRVLPLAYTGSRLGGSEREMARKLGLPALVAAPGPTGDLGGDAAAEPRWGSAAEIGAALAGVLERDPVAVRAALADLTGVRDRAAGALAFELAGRVQAEIEAVRWITSTQRVTVAGAGDCEVYGAAGGVLVHLRVRDGRLCRWRQRECPAGEAERWLAATPAQWQPFAQRAAELAATLTLR